MSCNKQSSKSQVEKQKKIVFENRCTQTHHHSLLNRFINSPTYFVVVAIIPARVCTVYVCIISSRCFDLCVVCYKKIKYIWWIHFAACPASKQKIATPSKINITHAISFSEQQKSTYTQSKWIVVQMIPHIHMHTFCFSGSCFTVLRASVTHITSHCIRSPSMGHLQCKQSLHIGLGGIPHENERRIKNHENKTSNENINDTRKKNKWKFLLEHSIFPFCRSCIS